MSVIEELTNEDIDIINETENTLNSNDSLLNDEKLGEKKEKTIKPKVKKEKTTKPEEKKKRITKPKPKPTQKIDELPVLGWW